MIPPQATHTSQLKVGHLNYVNAYPLYAGLVQGAIPRSSNLVPGHPAQLNKMLADGEVDLSLVSSYAYLTNADKYDLLPGFCIAATDSVRSVNLYYKGSLDDLDGQPLALTEQSASSAALVKAFCHTFWHVKPSFVPLPDIQACTEYPAFLLIGDQALLHPGFPGYNRIDLAEAFYDKTQVPMTFAVFAVRKGVMRERGDEVHTFSQELDASIRWAEANTDAICQMAADSSPIPIQILREYYPLMRYRLDKPQLNGLRTFATLANLEIPQQVEEALCRP